ncbi:DUF4132 domain-containing protein [Kitasatospora viridis]|uniref:Uncharacterized protein DUF4132 n=1 Tax=Kitasatospora viridis TaxID=281105 RepID=A0A561UNA7_9ACTN|nr:DUF4132 domain-containing protein [Kitasatospora viridis]TWG00841.1 uncharacterized protein DUF4132 [Kitasatospora viridis]
MRWREPQFPFTNGEHEPDPLVPARLARAIARARRADRKLYRRRIESDPRAELEAPRSLRLAARLTERQRRDVALRLQRERGGLGCRDHEPYIAHALAALPGGWQPAQVHRLFAYALSRLDPVRPRCDWLDAAESLLLPMTALRELPAAEQHAFQPYLRTVVAAWHSCLRREHPARDPEDETLRTGDERAAAEVRALLVTEHDPDPLLAAGDRFTVAVRCLLGARVYEPAGGRLLALLADRPDGEPADRWRGRVRELAQLAPGTTELLDLLLIAGRHGAPDCRAHLGLIGQPAAESSHRLLTGVAHAVGVIGGAGPVEQLTRTLEFQLGESLEPLARGAAAFQLAGTAALTAQGAHSQVQRLLAARQRLYHGRISAPVGTQGTAELVIRPDEPAVQLAFRDQRGRVVQPFPFRYNGPYDHRLRELDVLRDALDRSARRLRAEVLEQLSGTADLITQPAADWQAKWLDDPALVLLSRSLIWQADTPAGPVTGLPVLRQDAVTWQLRGLKAQRHPLRPDSPVRLWRPGPADEAKVLRWRTTLTRLKVRQPVAQV